MRHCIFTLSLTVLVCVISIGTAKASDPLKKPQLWQQIATSPADSLLWSSYMGKPWVSMTIQEKEQIEDWKGQLKQLIVDGSKASPLEQMAVAQNQEEEQAFWDNQLSQEQVSANEKIRKEKELQEHFKSLEKVMVSMPSYIIELRRNLTANFTVLDEAFREEFLSIEVSYKGYFEEHPKGDYPKEKWINEKAHELMKFKQMAFEKMKIEMVASSSK